MPNYERSVAFPFIMGVYNPVCWLECPIKEGHEVAEVLCFVTLSSSINFLTF